MVLKRLAEEIRKNRMWMLPTKARFNLGLPLTMSLGLTNLRHPNLSALSNTFVALLSKSVSLNALLSH